MLMGMNIQETARRLIVVVYKVCNKEGVDMVREEKFKIQGHSIHMYARPGVHSTIYISGRELKDLAAFLSMSLVFPILG